MSIGRCFIAVALAGALMTSGLAAASEGIAHAAQPLKIVLSNDDGLSENVKALYSALLAAGHQVVLSIPCQNQSGKGAALSMLTPLTALTKNCRGGAALAGAPGVGAIESIKNAFYVDGTPIMATMYGLDIAAQHLWQSAPDLVISGPNEGPNLGSMVLNSGTVSNAQLSIARGTPAIAVSADMNTIENPVLAKEAAELTVNFLAALQRRAGNGRILPEGVALNVNFPKFEAGASTQLRWRATRFGNFDIGTTHFVEDLGADAVAASYGLRDAHYPGVSVTLKSKSDATASTDLNSEALQSIAGFATVTPMQLGYELPPNRAQSLKAVINDVIKTM